MATTPTIPSAVIADVQAKTQAFVQLQNIRDGLLTRFNAAADSIDRNTALAKAFIDSVPAPAPSANDPLMTGSVFVNGVLDPTLYAERAASMGTEPGAKYLYGPSASYYGVPDSDLPLLYRNPDGDLDVIAAGYGNNDAIYGRNKLRGCAVGRKLCGTWQIGGPPKPGQGGMFSSSQGQGLFIPDNRQASSYGIGITDFCQFSVSENIVSMKPELYFGYYGGGADPYAQLEYKNRGLDISYPVDIARCEDRPGWDIATIGVTRNGLVTMNGQNTGNNKASLQLPANKKPTSLCVTRASSFALITVWDTTSLKGQVAVIALAGTPQDGYLGNEANWGSYRDEWRGVYPGLPSYGNISFMKLVCFVDLPFQTPSAISATSAWIWQDYSPMAGAFNLSDANTRQRLRSGDRAAYTPRQGIALVVSKEEKKGAFIDLGPLYRAYVDLYYGVNAPPSVATGTFPPTFDQLSSSQVPVVVKTVTFSDRPTSVKLSIDQRRAFVGLQGGVMEMWSLGDYPLPRLGNPDTIQKKGQVACGRNPTCIAIVQRHAGSAGKVAGKDYFGEAIFPGAKFNDYIFVTSRGDRKTTNFKIASDMTSASVFFTLRDRAIKDPVWFEDNANHTTETYIGTTSDYEGKQIVNTRYGPAIFWDNKGVMADDPSNPLTYDWDACPPPNGQPVKKTMFNGVEQQGENGGTYPLPGRVIKTACANTY